MPAQGWADLASNDERSAGNAGWGDLAGGVEARPYVTSLRVINGSSVTPVITNGNATATSVPAGTVTPVVSPFNLCKIGQTPSPGSCYATPNRVGLTVGYSNGDGVGNNFADPSVPVTPAVGASTVIDMTVALNTLGRNLRWTWVNGDLLYWQTSNLGRADASVHVKFRPAPAPYVAQFPANNGCTATPIRDCALARADAEVLSASLVFSLDNTLDATLSGAAFATQNAVFGYLQPSGPPDAPTLDIQVASTHTKADGSPQRGTLQAFIPAAALVNLYSLMPADASTTFVTTRTGDAGTNSPPNYQSWNAAANGSDGLFVTVRNITFSVPKYKVANKLRRIATSASVRGATTTVKSTIAGCTKTSTCRATVYDLGLRTAPRYAARLTPVLVNKTLATTALALAAPASKLSKNHRYLLVVRSVKLNKLLASTTGTVS
jgi:hypothetical protein